MCKAFISYSSQLPYVKFLFPSTDVSPISMPFPIFIRFCNCVGIIKVFKCLETVISVSIGSSVANKPTALITVIS